VNSVKFTNPHGSLALAARNQDRSSAERVMTLRIRHGAGSARPAECALYRGRDQSDVFAGADGGPLGFLETVIMLDGRGIQISAGNLNDYI
jgi:hypothetical protein